MVLKGRTKQVMERRGQQNSAMISTTGFSGESIWPNSQGVYSTYAGVKNMSLDSDNEALKRENEALDREHNQLMGLGCLVYLVGGAMFISALALIDRFELGTVWYIICIAVGIYLVRAADNGNWPFSLLDQWEQSILERRSDAELIHAYSRGKKIIKYGREAEVIDGCIVPKPGGIELIPPEEQKPEKHETNT